MNTQNLIAIKSLSKGFIYYYEDGRKDFVASLTKNNKKDSFPTKRVKCKKGKRVYWTSKNE